MERSSYDHQNCYGSCAASLYRLPLVERPWRGRWSRAGNSAAAGIHTRVILAPAAFHPVFSGVTGLDQAPGEPTSTTSAQLPHPIKLSRPPPNKPSTPSPPTAARPVDPTLCRNNVVRRGLSGVQRAPVHRCDRRRGKLQPIPTAPPWQRSNTSQDSVTGLLLAGIGVRSAPSHSRPSGR